MAHCEDCGTKLRSGICPNCSEELYIYTEQYEYIDNPLSDEFMEMVREQEAKEKLRNNKHYV